MSFGTSTPVQGKEKVGMHELDGALQATVFSQESKIPELAGRDQI
jgi:hypothetical protein